MISFLFFACGGDPSYVRSRQEPERSAKISWRAKDRQINFLRGAVRCDPSQADRDIAAACSSSMIFVKRSRKVWASFTVATVPHQADQIGEGLGVGVGDLSLSICGQPAGRSSSKGLLGQLLRGIRGADPWIEARTQSGPRRKHSARTSIPIAAPFRRTHPDRARRADLGRAADGSDAGDLIEITQNDRLHGDARSRSGVMAKRQRPSRIFALPNSARPPLFNNWLGGERRLARTAPRPA
jgi:hypothetical protein